MFTVLWQTLGKHNCSFAKTFGDQCLCLQEVHGRTVTVVQHSGKVYALDTSCFHQGGPLGAQGDIEDIDGLACIRCPWHGYRVKSRIASSFLQREPAMLLVSIELYTFLDGLFSSTLPPVATSRQTWQEMSVSIMESSVFTASTMEGMDITGKCCSSPSLSQQCNYNFPVTRRHTVQGRR